MLNEVTFEHESIKSILESNQKAWLKPMGKHVLSNDASDCLPTQGMMDDEITSPNQFTILLDVDVNSKSSSEEETISPDDLETLNIKIIKAESVRPTYPMMVIPLHKVKFLTRIKS